MTNKELQQYLAQYPGDMPIKLLTKGNSDIKTWTPIEFTEDNICHSSETAYVDTDAPEDEWDWEDGKIELGDGQQYLLLNPIIV